MLRHSTPRAAGKPPRQHDPVYGITTAEEALSADIARRQKQYLMTMTFRVVAIVVVVWVPGISWPVKIVLAVAATIIPFIAVVRANGGPPPEHDPTNLLINAPSRPAIEGPDHSLAPGEEFLAGESWEPFSESGSRQTNFEAPGGDQPDPEDTDHSTADLGS